MTTQGPSSPPVLHPPTSTLKIRVVRVSNFD
jgi:hypothetical protein